MDFIMPYVRSLRFKFMLLCLLPMLVEAFVFIAHSLIIASQVREMAAGAYLAAAANAGAPENIANALRGVSLNFDFILLQWAAVFVITAVVIFIPTSAYVKRLIMPIREVSAYSDHLAQGNVDIEVVKNRTDEIGVMQESFHRLVFASRQQAELLSRMADGDISGSYIPRSPSDVVGNSLVKMLERNNAAMAQVLMSTKELAGAAAQIADGSQALASGSSEQAASIQELSAVISEVSRSSHDNAKMADKASALGLTIKQNAEKGSRQMDQMLAAVKDISDASRNINKVIKVIDDIAFQTNILALNAAVEAARAGQHGKGFAVVAEEVRNLASKSAEAAKNTNSLIANSIEKAELGASIAEETSASLAEIVAGINESSQIIAEIAHSYEVQDQSVSHITSSMAQVSQVVQQNSATAEEAASSSEEMSSQSVILQGLVSQFKLKSSADLFENDAPSSYHSQPLTDTGLSYYDLNN